MLLSSSSHLVFYRAGSVRGLVQINVMCKHKMVKGSDIINARLAQGSVAVSSKDARRCLQRTATVTTLFSFFFLTVSAVYDVTLNFRGNKNPSLLGILYGKKYEADMCVR